MDYKTGTLIEFRNRPWVVQQSGDDDLMIIKPLVCTAIHGMVVLLSSIYKRKATQKEL